MPEKINVMLNVQVVAGPKASASLTKEVEAYDKIKVSIDAGATDKDVEDCRQVRTASPLGVRDPPQSPG